MGKEKTAHEQTLCFDGNACHWEAFDHGFKVLCVYEGGETLLKVYEGDPVAIPATFSRTAGSTWMKYCHKIAEDMTARNKTVGTLTDQFYTKAHQEKLMLSREQHVYKMWCESTDKGPADTVRRMSINEGSKIRAAIATKYGAQAKLDRTETESR